MVSASSPTVSPLRGEAAEPSLIPSTRLDFSAMLNLSYWKWRENPATMIPAMINAAVGVASQGVLFLFLMAILSRLASTGVLKDLAEAFESAGPEEVVRALAQPEVLNMALPAAAAALVIFVAVNVVGTGFATSAEYGTYVTLLQKGTVGVGDVLRELGRRWAAMAWTALVVNVAAWGPLCVALLPALYLLIDPSLFASGSAPSQPGATTWLLASLVSILLLAIVGFAVYCLSTYSYAAVAVSGKRGLGAVRESFGVFRSAPGTSAIYVLVRIGITVSFVLLTFLAGVIGVSLYSLITVILSLSLTPVLHLLKTQVCFMQRGLPLPPLPFIASTSIARNLSKTVPRRLLGETRKGLTTLSTYLGAARNLPYHLASLLFFLLGTAVGSLISSSGLSQLIFAAGYRPGSINSEFVTGFPPSLGVDISFHNWQVSLATALSGLAVTLPAAISLVSNGFLLGLLASLTPKLTMFFAAILPHGVIELPCFFVAGSSGMRLGVEAAKAWRRGSMWDDARLRVALGETVYIVIGLAPFFLVAGLIEAIVTPSIMTMFGWT